jgi:glycoprotein endo-alpha-1,2-mannosidase
VNTDERAALAVRAAEEAGVQIAWHLEPYAGRSAATVVDDVQYLEASYGQSPAVYREQGKAVFFVYDSYHISPVEWAGHLPSLSGIFVGLWLNRDHLSHLVLPAVHVGERV